MKKLILILIVSWIGLNVSAQSFDTYVKHNNSEFPVFDIISLPNQNYIIGATQIYSPGNYSTIIYKLSNNGQLLDSLEFDFPITNLYFKNQEIYFFGSLNNSNQKDTIIIGIINPLVFDTLKVKKHISKKISIAARSVIFSNYCNCFTVVGIAADINSNALALIYQVDSQLNILKEKYYDAWYSPVSGYPVFHGVLENPSKSGLWILSEPLDSITGWQGGAGAVIPIDSNLVRDSTTLNLLLTNQSYVNFAGDIGIIPEPFDGVKLTDSTYLFAGRILLEKFQGGNQVGLEDDMGYLIMDNNLNLVKSEFYGKSDTIDVSAFNMVDRNEDYVYLLSTSRIGGSLFGNFDNFFGLTKVDESGTRLWTKYYSSGNYKYAFSVGATTDGGAIMVGRTYDGNKGTGPEYDIYVLKVDSNGNKSTTGIKDVKQISSSNFRIYPNPVKTQLHLLKVNDFRNYSFNLYDSFGREVMQKQWTANEQLISTASLTPGVYIYRLIDSQGRVASGKLVKQ